MSHYLKKSYLSDTRLFAYIEQYKYVNERDNVLEVGKGAGVFGDIVKKIANYTCIDIDESTQPDIVANITDWDNIKHLEGKFDVIFCCQVLEHMPLEQSKVAFENLLKLAAKRVVISIPDNRASFRINVRLPKVNYKKVFSLPWSGRDVNLNNNKEHYWEVYSGNYKKIKLIFCNSLQSYKLIEEYRFFERYKQRFYIYEKVQISENKKIN